VSGIEQRIADVLRDHMGEYADGEDGRYWATYVASVLVAELGLKQQTRWRKEPGAPLVRESLYQERCYTTDWERAE
jgi:hypothetical protein